MPIGFRRAAAGNGLPEAHYNQGVALEAMKKNEAAVEAYRQALSIQPAYAPAAYQLGRLLVQEGQKEEGLALIDTALEAETDPIIRKAIEDTRDRLAGEPAIEEEPGT